MYTYLYILLLGVIREKLNSFIYIRLHIQVNVGKDVTLAINYRLRATEHHLEKYLEPQSETNRGVE